MNYNKDAEVRINFKNASYGYLVEDCIFSLKALLKYMLLQSETCLDDLRFTKEKCEAFDIAVSLINNAAFFALNAYESAVHGKYLVTDTELKGLLDAADKFLKITVNDKFVDTKTFLKNLTSDLYDYNQKTIAEVSKQVHGD